MINTTSSTASPLINCYLGFDNIDENLVVNDITRAKALLLYLRRKSSEACVGAIAESLVIVENFPVEMNSNVCAKIFRAEFDYFPGIDALVHCPR
jgi:hypothetical protein